MGLKQLFKALHHYRGEWHLVVIIQAGQAGAFSSCLVLMCFNQRAITATVAVRLV